MTAGAQLAADADAVVAEYGVSDRDHLAYSLTRMGWDRRAASVAVSAAIRRATASRATEHGQKECRS